MPAMKTIVITSFRRGVLPKDPPITVTTEDAFEYKLAGDSAKRLNETIGPVGHPLGAYQEMGLGLRLEFEIPRSFVGESIVPPSYY